MRFLRFIIFILVVEISYLAQFIFEQRHLSELVTPQVGLSRLGPARIGALNVPTTGFISTLVVDLGEFVRMSPSELLVLGMFAVLLSSILFGLVSTRWLPTLVIKNTVITDASLEGREEKRSTTYTIGMLVAVIALGLVVVVAAQISSFGLDNILLQSLWIGGLALYLAGSILIGRGQGWGQRWGQRPGQEQQDPTSISNDGKEIVTINPTAGWPALLAILIGAAILYLWQLWLMPARIDRAVAEIGLQSLAILQGDVDTLFHPGTTGLPMLAYIPSALAINLTGDPLFGVRLIGVGTGLLMLIATWLLCTELFRRTPRFGSYGTLIEDDGRWIALLATVILAFGHVTLHFSRLPIFLGPVTWGTLGLWALLRGLRSQNGLTLALSGMMIGLAGVLYGGGFFFLLISPMWWIGIWLLQRRWLSSARGVGSLGLLLWLGGITVVLLPFFSVWSRLPLTFSAFLQNNFLLGADGVARSQALFASRGVDYLFWDNLRLTLFTFNIYPNNGPLFDSGGPFLNSWLAPLLFLGVGALILNLDRLPGWLLLVSVSAGVILAAVNLNVPFWLRLLPILPLVAIIIAFTIDRARVILLETAGVWMEQTTVYLALGLVAWASLQGWLDYYNYAMRQDASSSHIGRAIQSMAPEQTAVLLFNQRPIDENSPEQDDSSLLEQNGFDITVIDFISSGFDGPRDREEITVGDWPEKEELPANSRIIIQPSSAAWIDEIKERYEGGLLMPVRNLRGDPVLYTYDFGRS